MTHYLGSGGGGRLEVVAEEEGTVKTSRRVL